MKNVVKLILISALALVVVSCGNVNDSSDTEKETSSVSSISETDSSNESSETESFEVESSETDSSEDESSKAVTTTKETAKTTTTTKQTTTQPAVTTKPYVAPTTTTQKPVVTTKTTTKQTTKATTKATTKITTSKIVKPSNLTRYEDALWEVMVNKNYSKTNTKYLEIIRQEAIKYAQNGWIKQYYDAVGGFEVNSKMYPFVKNGKPYYVYEKGIVNAAVEFDDADIMYGKTYYSNTSEALYNIKAQINGTDRLIARILANACRHGEPDIQWNLTYGISSDNSIEWYCITGFASTWK
jgi:uncharacterized glyoxalase superfamily protein PhnB